MLLRLLTGVHLCLKVITMPIEFFSILMQGRFSYIKINNNKVGSIKTGQMVIALLIS